jgi:predicted PurR-regulated permease PerM
MTGHPRASLTTFLALLLLFMVIVHKMIYAYLLSVFMGGLLSLLSYPLYRSLRAGRVGARTASAIVTLGLILVVLIPVSAFVVTTIRQAAFFGERLARSEGLSPSRVVSRVASLPMFKTFDGDPGAVEKQFKTQIRAAGAYASGWMVRLARNIPDFLLQLALASIACFFFLMDGPSFIAWLMAKVPLDIDVRYQLIESFKNTAISSMWGGLAAAAVQSAMMAGAFLALRVPGALVAGGVTFVLAWTPIIGSTPTWLAGAVYLYVQDSPARMAVMLGLGLLTGVMDNVVRSWVLKGREDMHPLVSLIAIIGGIEMFGILGVFVGPVLAAIFIALLGIWPEVARRAGLALEKPAAGA